MVGIDQLDQHLVRAGRHVHDVDDAAVVCISPVPGQVVDVWRPMRGDTSSAAAPNSDTMRAFSVRYWICTAPWATGIGASTTSLGAASWTMGM
jgi:hypothetical protein